MLNNRAGWIAILAMLSLSGCVSTAPVKIQSNAIDDVRLSATRCALNLKLVDSRPSVELGSIGFKEFQFQDYPSYLQRQLDRKFYATSDKATLEAHLLRAYIETNRSTLTFNVVIKLEGETPARIYRGDTTSTNFFNSQPELAAYMERATRELIEKIAVGENCPALKP